METQNQQKNYPNIIDFDMATALVSKWRVKKSEYQKAAGDAAIEVWDHVKWPEGLLSHSVYLGNDEHTIFQYSQWTGSEAIEAFTQKNLPKRAEIAHERVPGLERIEAIKYRHYRSMLSDHPEREPGCIILVEFETGNHAIQKEFVDSLIETMESKKNLHHFGSIASHFHVSLDGNRVLNYAEFTSEQAHEEIVQAHLQDGDEVPNLIRNIPGLKTLGFKRYRLFRSAANLQQEFLN